MSKSVTLILSERYGKKTASYVYYSIYIYSPPLLFRCMQLIDKKLFIKKEKDHKSYLYQLVS